jgi:hypothetical protein
MRGPLGSQIVAHEWFRVSGMKVPGRVHNSPLLDGQAHIWTKVLGPGGHDELQTEFAGMLKAFVKPAVKCAITPVGRLNILHESLELIAAINSTAVIPFWSRCQSGEGIFLEILFGKESV